MPDSKIVATLCLSGQFNLRAPQGENKRERTRIGRPIHPVKENEPASTRIIRELKRWLPRSRMPTAILTPHDLNRLAPVGQGTRWILCAAPPQPSLQRNFTPSHPDASKDSLESAVSLPKKSNIFISAATKTAGRLQLVRPSALSE
jgi:hypothetical protein